jgi:hypothetical protein
MSQNTTEREEVLERTLIITRQQLASVMAENAEMKAIIDVHNARAEAASSEQNSVE